MILSEQGPGPRRVSGDPAFPAEWPWTIMEELEFNWDGRLSHGRLIVQYRERRFNIHGFPDRNVQHFHLLRLRIVQHLRHNVQHFLPNVQV